MAQYYDKDRNPIQVYDTYGRAVQPEPSLVRLTVKWGVMTLATPQIWRSWAMSEEVDVNAVMGRRAAAGPRGSKTQFLGTGTKLPVALAA